MLKILIADDDDIFAGFVQTCVDWSALGAQAPARAKTGPEAAELALRLRPDIVIMDVEMPGCSGLECVEKIRRSGNNCEILLVTGYDEFRYAQCGASYGVTDIMLKPVSRQELQLQLCSIVNKHWIKRVSSLVMESLMGKSRPIGILNLFEEDLPKGSVIDLAAEIMNSVIENELSDLAGHISRYMHALESWRAPNSQMLWMYSFPGLICAELLQESEAVNIPAPLNDRHELAGAIQAALFSRTVDQTLAELCTQTAAILQGQHKNGSSQAVEDAYRMILNNYSDPKFSVAALAEATHFCESYLRRVFKAEFGRSPNSLLKEIRMNQARKLISGGNMQIQQAARLVGFDDAAYFSKCFKQFFGYSPSEQK